MINSIIEDIRKDDQRLAGFRGKENAPVKGKQEQLCMLQ